MSKTKNILFVFSLFSLAALSGTFWSFFQTDSTPGGIRITAAEEAASPYEESSSQTAFVKGESSEAPLNLVTTPLLDLEWAKVTKKSGTRQYRNGDFIITPDKQLRIATGVVTSSTLRFHTIETEDIDTEAITSRTIEDGAIRSSDLDHALTIDNLSISESFSTSSQNAFRINPFNTASGNTGELRFYELAANGANYIGFKSPDSIVSNIIWTLPSADGINNQVLTTNGNGTLVWQTAAGTGAPTDATYLTLSYNSSLSNERLLTGNSQITITDGGADAAATLSITADSIGDTQLAYDTGQTLTTVATPTFAGLTLSGFSTNGGLLYTNGSGTLSQTGAGTATTVLHGGTTPSYSAVSLTADVSGTLPIANGGTGATTVIDAQTALGLTYSTQQDYLNRTNIAAWGDSLTLFAGGTNLSYPAELARLTGKVVYNGGVSSENSGAIKARMLAATDKYSYPTIIWAGRNNFASGATVKQDIADMVAALTHTNYIVMGILNQDVALERSGGANYNIIVQLNADLAAIYGSRYIDIRTYLIQNGLTDAGITPTAQDLTDIANDVLPSSLRAVGDALHLNATGYSLVAQKIYQNINLLTPSKATVLTPESLAQINLGGTIVRGVKFLDGLNTNQSTLVGMWVGGNLSTTSLQNTGVGFEALYASAASSASYNTAIGAQTLFSLNDSAAVRNTAIGAHAMFTNTAGYNNTAVGYNSLFYNTLGTSNTAIGVTSMQANTIGTNNTALGNGSLSTNQTGSNNTAVGFGALGLATASENTAIGLNAFANITTGGFNVAVGRNAGIGDGTTVDQRSSVDTYSVFIGYRASRDSSVPTATVLTNSIAIGKNARVGASNSMVLGGTGADAVNVGIGDITPAALFTVGSGDLFQVSSLGNVSTTGQISGMDGLVTKVNAGACDDTTFTADTNGNICIDSTNGRIYYRYGAAWHYSAATAGFQIPNYETFGYDFTNRSFDTNKPFKTDDFLIPFVENFMQDGAAHGLYAKFSDVKDTLFAEEKADIAALSFKTDQNITTLGGLQASVDEQLSVIGEKLQALTEKTALLSSLDKATGTVANDVTAEPSSPLVWDEEKQSFVMKQDMEIMGKFVIGDDVKVLGDASFSGETVFEKSPTFNSDTGGLAVIREGEREVEIVFDTPFEAAPIVTVTITNAENPLLVPDASESLVKDINAVEDDFVTQYFENNLKYLVTKKSARGFTIIINEKASRELEFSWVALSVHAKKTFYSAPSPTEPPITETDDPLSIIEEAAPISATVPTGTESPVGTP